MQRDACPRRRLSWPPLCECTLGWIGECVGGPLSVTCVEWADPALVCEESHHRCRTPTSAWRDARRRRARVPHAARGSLRCRPTVQSCQQRLSCLKDALPRMELWSRRPRPLLFLLRQPTRKAKRELHRRHGVASTLRSLRSLYPRLRLQGRRIQ